MGGVDRKSRCVVATTVFDPSPDIAVTPPVPMFFSRIIWALPVLKMPTPGGRGKVKFYM
jgi:hypothetical protein